MAWILNDNDQFVNDETGDTFQSGDSSGVTTAAAAAGNDVWSVLKANAGGIIGAVRDVALKRGATTATPSGAAKTTSFNPFPGLFSSFPQADAKQTPASAGMGFPSINPAWLLIGVLVVLALLVFRRA